MVDRIDAAYQSEKAFISNASHELNNPLTAIQGECEISLLKERSPEEYQAALRRIATETSRIIQLIKHLLFLSHGDKEIQKSAMETIFLADFLMQFSSARISFSPDNFSYMISANPYLLKIAIKNILSNACKYSDDKPVEMRLRGSVLTISDRGIGSSRGIETNLPTLLQGEQYPGIRRAWCRAKPLATHIEHLWGEGEYYF